MSIIPIFYNNSRELYFCILLYIFYLFYIAKSQKMCEFKNKYAHRLRGVGKQNVSSMYPCRVASTRAPMSMSPFHWAESQCNTPPRQRHSDRRGRGPAFNHSEQETLMLITGIPTKQTCFPKYFKNILWHFLNIFVCAAFLERWRWITLPISIFTLNRLKFQQLDTGS